MSNRNAPTLLHGWAVRETETEVRLSKGNEWVVTRGRKGIAPGVMLERALIAALEKDVANAVDPEQRREAERALHRAIAEEQVSQVVRRNAAESAGE
jgi:hypothetical protein